MPFLLAHTNNFDIHAKMVSFICYTLNQRITEAEALALIRSHIPAVEKGARTHTTIKRLSDQDTKDWIHTYFIKLTSARKFNELPDVPFYQPFYRLQLKAAVAHIQPLVENEQFTTKEHALQFYDFYKTTDKKFAAFCAALCLIDLAITIALVSIEYSAVHLLTPLFLIAAFTSLQINSKARMDKQFFNKGANLYQQKISAIPEKEKVNFPSIFNASGTNNIVKIEHKNANAGGCASSANPPLQNKKTVAINTF